MTSFIKNVALGIAILIAISGVLTAVYLTIHRALAPPF